MLALWRACVCVYAGVCVCARVCIFMCLKLTRKHPKSRDHERNPLLCYIPSASTMLWLRFQTFRR